MKTSIGIDYHKRYSVVCVMNEAGTILAEERIDHAPVGKEEKMRSLFRLLWAVLALLPCCALAEEQIVPDETARRLEMIKASEDIIAFYGRLVDQYGSPVEGATVTFHVGQATLLPKAPLELRVVSDTRGNFAIDPKREIKGSLFSVDNIEKDGYEMNFSTVRRDFDRRRNNPHRFVPEKAKPVVFCIRKKELTLAFVLEERFLELETRAIASGGLLGYDFVRRHRIKDAQNLVYDGEPVFPDLQVKATFNTNDATWTAVLSPGNTNGGIIVSEQLLYEAPDAGYQPEYTFTPEDRKPVKAKYVYLKSRDPAIFTRLEIEQINANKDFFRLSGKSVTNPYGDRNLEQATDLPYEVTKQLTDEAKTAFRQNKRPTKPDLPKLVKEAKEKADEGKP
ncbi:MAG: hypothetical protein H3C50_07820 [Kiritimatiellae bacterium]|nr:hypothetical protein [Kiritimatiellia bacterium]